MYEKSSQNIIMDDILVILEVRDQIYLTISIVIVF